MRRIAAVALLIVGFILAASPSEAACANPFNLADGALPVSKILIAPQGDNYSSAAGTVAALTNAINRWNVVCDEDDVPELRKQASINSPVFKVHFRKGTYNITPHVDFCAVVVTKLGSVLWDRDIYIFERTRSGLDCTAYVDGITTHEFGHALGLDHSSCSDNIMSNLDPQLTVGNVPKSSDCKAVDRFWLTPAEAVINPPPPPPCECSFASDCTGNPGTGTWACIFCQCLLLNSPLVLHLPDYLTTGSDPRWWEHSFCGPGAPTVCLDWWGDGQVSCNSWPESGSGVAFVVALSADDSLALSGGLSILVEPWRHLFGNVTMGPAGDFPFEHGFSALSAHCGVDPGERGLIDFAECQQSLHVWEDSSGDGSIDPGEVLELSDLDIKTLGGIQTTHKRDSCGNVFPFETHATCNGRDGRCGYWLDVFFEPR